MSKKAVVDPSQPVSPEATHQAAKAAFDEAVAKTKAQQGVPPEPEPEAEEVEEKPRKEKRRDESSELLISMREELAALRQAVTESRKEPAAVEDDGDEYEEIQAQLSERFGDDEGALLAKIIKGRDEAKNERIRKIEKLLEDGMKRSRAQIERANRTRLQAKYPQLEDDEAWEMLSGGAVSALQKSDSKYASPEDAYDAKAKALFGATQRGIQPSEEEIEEASRIAASQPSQPGRAPRERKLTGMEAHRAVFDHLRKGGSVAEASALARQAVKNQKKD